MSVLSLEMVPSDGVRRILAAAGAHITDQDAYWLGLHMIRFVNYARIHCELLDLPVSVEAYLSFVRQGNPTDWQVDQVKMALHFFSRGTERWQWIKASQQTTAVGMPGFAPNPIGTSLPSSYSQRKDVADSSFNSSRDKFGPQKHVLEQGVSARPQVVAGAQASESPLLNREWVLRYRVKVSGVNAGVISGVGAVSPAGPPPEMEDWLAQTKRALRLNHYSIRTEQSYIDQTRRFLLFTGPVKAEELGEVHVQRFLEYMAIQRMVSASTQNQAFSALLFFFKRVLNRPLGDMEETVRASRGRRLPEVLSRDEVKRFLALTEGPIKSSAGLLTTSETGAKSFKGS